MRLALEGSGLFLIYTTSLNLNVKVLDSVQFGGPGPTEEKRYSPAQ